VVTTSVIFFLSGFFTSQYLKGDKPSKSRAQQQKTKRDFYESRGGGYKFINPLLECDFYYPPPFSNTAMTEYKVREYIDKVVSEKKATEVAMYFRELNNGPWFGVNEQKHFVPASLLKLPILIAALKMSETDNNFLKKRVRFTRIAYPNIKTFFHDPEQIKLGETYAIEELMERMIIHSDNEARQLVAENMSEEFLQKVFSDFGFITAGNLYSDDNVSPKLFSGCFRLLYNATYLRKDLSEKALEILSRTTFHQGIVAGIQPGVTVAHKFGERGLDRAGLAQLHDCGIIYLPGSPYLLCVMTRGYDLDTQTNIIKEISAMIYRDLSRGRT